MLSSPPRSHRVRKRDKLTLQEYFTTDRAQWPDPLMRAGIQELSVKGETTVHEGIYKLEFKDPPSLGVIMLIGGRIVGTDGVFSYDGTYDVIEFGKKVQAEIRCTPRLENCFVQQPFDVNRTFLASGSTPITVTPPGLPTVDVDVIYMRGLS